MKEFDYVLLESGPIATAEDVDAYRRHPSVIKNKIAMRETFAELGLSPLKNVRSAPRPPPRRTGSAGRIRRGVLANPIGMAK